MKSQKTFLYSLHVEPTGDRPITVSDVTQVPDAVVNINIM